MGMQLSCGMDINTQKEEYIQWNMCRFGVVLHKLAKQKEMQILEGRLLLDLIYILISIPLKYSVSSVVGYIKWEVSCI